jgi:L-alanine-DL-glutamate epimerase-like enolase superfamily enzyme
MNSTIAQVNTYRVAYPVRGHFKFFAAEGDRPPMRETVVVRIVDEAGNEGWGQSVPSHTWSYETVESAQTTIDRYLGPALLGQDPFDEAGIRRILDRTIAPLFTTGQPIAKAGVDLALFDLTGRILQQSAAERWGRTGRDRITLSWTVNPQSLDDVGQSVAEAGAAGFHHFNVKVGGDVRFDVQVCAELRRLAPEAFIWVDANGGYDLETALDAAPKFADVGVAAFEQPMPANRLSWHRRLRKQKALPVILDEPIVSAVDLEELHRLELLDGVAMKVARCGGLSEARKILQYMEEHGLLFFASGLTDPDLSLAASLLLFGAYDLERPAALNGPQFLSGTVLAAPVDIEGDQAVVPTGPGLGEVDLEKLAKLSSHK